jgi:hypothetical protein
MMTNQHEPIPITHISLDDLEGLGFDISRINQSELRQLAQNMEDAYLDQSFWQDLDFFADKLKLPRI